MKHPGHLKIYLGYAAEVGIGRPLSSLSRNRPAPSEGPRNPSAVSALVLARDLLRVKATFRDFPYPSTTNPHPESSLRLSLRPLHLCVENACPGAPVKHPGHLKTYPGPAAGIGIGRPLSSLSTNQPTPSEGPRNPSAVSALVLARDLLRVLTPRLRVSALNSPSRISHILPPRTRLLSLLCAYLCALCASALKPPAPELP